MSQRFFSSAAITTECVALDGREAHHLLHVMRAADGQRVTIFDGSGAEFDAIVSRRGRAKVELRIAARREADHELPFALIVGVALPKGDRQKWLVEKLTELGVTALVPLVTERGVAQPTGSALARLERSVIEACKQCGRNRLLRVADPAHWLEFSAGGDDYLATLAAGPSAKWRRILAHPGGRRLSAGEFAAPCPTVLAIGPEGGFTGAELEAAAAWQRAGLGRRILRVETAAVALAGAVAIAADTPP